MNPVYTGAIASQKKDYRFKIGTIGEKKPEDWIVVENQHEPIVDRKTFDIVQRKLKSRQRPRQTGEISRWFLSSGSFRYPKGARQPVNWPFCAFSR